MAVRKRFNATERALIAEAVKSDGAIQWQHGSHWKPAIIIDAEIKTGDGGYEYLIIRNEGKTTATLSRGAVVHVSPGHIRVA